ncbi:MAG: GNAT family N-acetyltransferase [Christensenellaceae bacterium]|nr:GNAT family N-acetyltransferase [Christensenellaceae bacterium]
MIKFLKSTIENFIEINDVYTNVISSMNKKGLYQWKLGIYPTSEDILDDIKKACHYSIYFNENIIGGFTVSDETCEEYMPIPWHFGGNVIELHKIAILESYQGKGIAKEIFNFIKQKYSVLGFTSLRWDTSSENEHSLKMSRKIAEHETGYFFVDSYKAKFVCFELRLVEDCPLLPIKMIPVFRHGSMTPWGGDLLRQMYGKDTPNSITGESMEVSTIPNLESTDFDGTILSELINKYGKNFVGYTPNNENKFPLLVKLIDAKDSLSIQVHPDDEYANKNENGKFGKEEAWLILHSEPGAKIIYGTKEFTEKDDLLMCFNSGVSPVKYLQYIDVEPGDVFYIPPGTVHALGKGIVVYEIQQSSDVTYRMWDWDRTDNNGNKRELHIDDSVACINVKNKFNKGKLGNSIGEQKLISGKAFRLNSINIDGNFTFNQKYAFSLITSLDDMTFIGKNFSMKVSKGDSIFIPNNCENFEIIGKGFVLSSSPKEMN